MYNFSIKVIFIRTMSDSSDSEFVVGESGDSGSFELSSSAEDESSSLLDEVSNCFTPH